MINHTRILLTVIFSALSLIGLFVVTGYSISRNLTSSTQAHTPPDAYGTPWPDGAISYRDESSRPHLVALAAERWNQINLGVRFVPVTGRQEADIIIREDSKELDRVCVYKTSKRLRCAAQTQIGFQAGRQSVLLLQDNNPQAPALQSLLDLDTLLHEFGHILGIPHLAGDCTIMNKGGADSLCKMERFEAYPQVSCGPYRQDILAAKRLYQRGRPVSQYCNSSLLDIISP